MRNLDKRKLFLLLSTDTALKILRHYFFLVPTGILYQSFIFTNNITATLTSILLLICCVYFISRDKKSGYILAWILTIISILSILSWGAYFLIKNIVSVGFIVFNTISLFADSIIVYYLLKPRAGK